VSRNVIELMFDPLCLQRFWLYCRDRFRALT